MDEQAVQAEQVLRRLKDENLSLRWSPVPPSGELVDWQRQPVSGHESLTYLHKHWAFPDHFDDSAAGRGLKGSLLRLFGRLAFRVLRPYLIHEREFLTNVVRLNDSLARRCDDIAEEVARRERVEAENDARLAAWLFEYLGDRPVAPHGSDPG